MDSLNLYVLNMILFDSKFGNIDHILSRCISYRFLHNIELPEGDGCWDFKKTGHNGYGQIKGNGKQLLAHRLSYEYFYGIDPGELFVLHRCDNRSCVRPDHLFLGTHTDNMNDAINKGRLPKGITHGMSLFTEDEIMFIRDKYDSGEMKTKEIARHFGCNSTTITMIVRRHNWRHIGGSESPR